MKSILIKRVTDSPSARLIGVTSNYPVSIEYPIDADQEGINREGISIKSSYQFQLSRRLNRKN